MRIMLKANFIKLFSFGFLRPNSKKNKLTSELHKHYISKQLFSNPVKCLVNGMTPTEIR